MKLIVDYREASLIEALKATSQVKSGKIILTTSNLEVGDIHVIYDEAVDASAAGAGNDRVKFMIERKTVSDYLSSSSDKRLKNQLIRMQQYQKEHPETHLIYLIEGSIMPQFGQPVDKYRPKNDPLMLYRSLLHRIYRDQANVIRSENLAESVLWLTTLALVEIKSISQTSTSTLTSRLEHDSSHSQMALHPPEPKTEFKTTNELDYLETVKVKKSDNLTSDRLFRLSLMQIPGVSIKVADAIAHQYKSLPQLIRAYDATPLKEKEKLLKDIIIKADEQTTSVENKSARVRRVGPALSTKIYQLLGGSPPR